MYRQTPCNVDIHSYWAQLAIIQWHRPFGKLHHSSLVFAHSIGRYFDVLHTKYLTQTNQLELSSAVFNAPHFGLNRLKISRLHTAHLSRMKVMAMLFSWLMASVKASVSQGSCYSLATHEVICDVAQASCSSPKSWYAPGHVSSSSGCCYCAASCENVSDYCNYYDTSEGSCCNMTTHEVSCDVAQASCGSPNVWYAPGFVLAAVPAAATASSPVRTCQIPATTMMSQMLQFHPPPAHLNLPGVVTVCPRTAATVMCRRRSVQGLGPEPARIVCRRPSRHQPPDPTARC